MRILVLGMDPDAERIVEALERMEHLRTVEQARKRETVALIDGEGQSAASLLAMLDAMGQRAIEPVIIRARPEMDWPTVHDLSGIGRRSKADRHRSPRFPRRR